MECGQCKAKWDGYKNMVASITLERIGDEHTYYYWFCPECEAYTVVWNVDQFLGSEETMKPMVLDRKKGDEIVALIKKCPNPDSKRCRCEGHDKLA